MAKVDQGGILTLKRSDLAQLIAKARQLERLRVLNGLPVELRGQVGLAAVDRLPSNVFDIDPQLLKHVVAVLLKEPLNRKAGQDAEG